MPRDKTTIAKITRENYDTEEHRAARRDAYRHGDPREVFEKEINHVVTDRAYYNMLRATLEEERSVNARTHWREQTLIPIAAELIEYWYNNAPETIHYRQPTPENILRAFESHRIGSMWARLLRMAHDAEKGGS